MLERVFEHKDEYTSAKQSKQTKGDLLTKIQNKITCLLEKHPLGKHSARVSHHEEGQNFEHKGRGRPIEKISPLMAFNSQGKLIPFIALIYSYTTRARQKVSCIATTML